jgi:hypothetical protein
MKNIPGIEISSYPLNETFLQCKFKMTFSDAIELCKRTKSGLLKNKDLKDWFFDRITEELTKSIQKKKEKV